MSNTQQRNVLINKIKQQLKDIKIISKNSIQVEAKEEKIRHRRQSLQLADMFQSERLMRRYSDEDEEEDRNNISTFNKKYTLLEKIGEGANAIVRRCEYHETKKIYAVKIITMDQEHILELKKNFLSIKLLRHPSLIKYHGLYFDLKKGLAYLIMQFFPFPNLLQLPSCSQSELKLIIMELLRVVNFIHQRNICHRDIKPENILFDSENKAIKLIDFGISKRTFQRGVRRDMLTIIGTSLYLAPQILMGGGYDERIDIWSIGVTIYKLIAGVTPFQSQYHSDTVNNIVKGQLKFNSQIWSKYSYFAKDFVSRLLKNREQRLTIKESLIHLWFGTEVKSGERLRKGSQQDDIRLPRIETFCIRIHQAFHQEQQFNMKNAISKQQDIRLSPERTEKKNYCKRLSLIENKEFDLSDSDEQHSPSTVTSKGECKQKSDN